MQRRHLLTTAPAAALAVPALATPGPTRLRVATGWPASAAGAADVVTRLAERIKATSGGSLELEVLSADKSGIAPLQLLEAVARGDVDAAHATAYYWTARSQAFNFFATVPFGMTANEHYTWLRHGGGLALWQQLGAEHGVLPLPCGNTGVQMGGWFRHKVTSLESLKGLKMRFPGLGGEIYRSLGALPVLLPAAEIKPALKDGRIDAAEWITPWTDIAMGLHEIVPHYYYPGIHEPGHTLELIVNPATFKTLRPAQQELLRQACALECLETQAHFAHENARELKTIGRLKGLQLLRLPNDVTQAFRRNAAGVIAAAVERDPLARKVHDSYYAFLRDQLRWAELGERAYWQARYT